MEDKEKEICYVTIERGGHVPMPKVAGRGRKKGNGKNIKLLNSLGIGDAAWGIPAFALNSVRQTAWKAGMKIQIRQIPDTETYVIKRLT